LRTKLKSFFLLKNDVSYSALLDEHLKSAKAHGTKAVE
jgi:hypothetical protein